jgi:anti-sigma B factor antagonist
MSVWTRDRVEIDLDEPGVAVVTLHGEHETYGAVAIERQLSGLAQRGRALVVDLTRATFIDSAVLGALLRARSRAEREGTQLVLVLGDAREPAIPRIFEITGLLRAFRVAPSRAEAVAAARGSLAAA